MNRLFGTHQILHLSLGSFFLAFATALPAAPALEPPDGLAGPPFVTAKAWAIADGRTGRLLWGHNPDEPRKAASTTKIMCARMVLQLARQNPNVLEEIVTFSKLADTTPGSTADLRAGESLTVGDCLYGLLLPSGNDAGNALAEHFNGRLAPPEPVLLERLGDPAKMTTRINFVAEMNRQARKLGMTNTVYRIPYGDGGSTNDVTTSPRDLLHLAWTALQDPLFHRMVNTRHHECTVKQPDGGERAAMWENTNELLGIEGYDGVKTGTTATAGHCLVSSGRLGKDHLLVVVLGSDSNAGRYVDTRNLFRWAWLQRGHRAKGAGAK